MRLSSLLILVSTVACSRVVEEPPPMLKSDAAPAATTASPDTPVEAGAPLDAAPVKPMPSIKKPHTHDDVPLANLHIKPSVKPLPTEVDGCMNDCASKNRENDAGADLVRFTCRKLCIDLCVARCQENKTDHGTCRRVCSGP